MAIPQALLARTPGRLPAGFVFSLCSPRSNPPVSIPGMHQNTDDSILYPTSAPISYRSNRSSPSLLPAVHFALFQPPIPEDIPLLSQVPCEHTSWAGQDNKQNMAVTLSKTPLRRQKSRNKSPIQQRQIY